MLPFRTLDRVKFVVERQLVKGAGFQLLVVAAFIALISIAGGLAVLAAGQNFDSTGAAIWWAFLRLTDPGYLGDDIGAWQRFVSTLLTVSGYVVFMGTLVAILTRWLIAKMEELERGLTPVTLKSHIVVLGWTRHTLPLLTELLGASGRMRRFLKKHDVGRLKLVVLSERAGAEQVHELRMEPGIGRRARQVILRSGLPIQSDALQRVACLDAAAVIVPSGHIDADSLLTPDVETIKALLSIAAQARHYSAPLPYVVAEIQDPRKMSVVERAYPGAVETVAGDATISRLMVQNILHPGLSEIYNELLTAAGGNEIYVRGGETMAGLTLAQIAAQRPQAIVLGLLKRQGGRWLTQLVAPADSVINPEDRVIMMARSYAETDPNSKNPPLAPINRSSSRISPVQSAQRPHKILILGWNRRVPSLLAELSSYSSPFFQVTVTSVIAATERGQLTRRRLGQQVELDVQHIEADYMIEAELRQLQPAAYDTVMLLSSDRLASGEEADARSMVGYLQLEDVLADQLRRPQLIMELSDPGNSHLLYNHGSEMLVNSMILSHVLAQVALRREFRVVLDELFTVGGAEIQFRDPEEYTLPASVDFQLLERTLAEMGEIALGIYRSQPDATGRHLVLNPPRGDYLDVQPGNRLVVLSLTD